jgi:hypothetical protein
VKADEVFRFVNLRPVQKAPSDHIERNFAAYNKGEKSPFHRKVEELQGDDAREKAVELARNHLTYNADPGQQLQVLVDVVGRTSSEKTVKKAKQVVADTLGKKVSDYLASNEAKQLKDLLWDSLYAHTLAPEERSEDRDQVYEGVRAIHFLERLANQGDAEAPMSWDELHSVTPIIPKGVIPDVSLIPENEEEFANVVEELKSVHAKLSSLNDVIADLKNTDRVYRAQQLQTVPDIALMENGTRPSTLQVRTKLLTAPSLEFPISPGVESELPDGESEILIEQRDVVVPPNVPWLFKEFGDENLKQSTRELIAARKTDLEELEAAETISLLEQDMFETASSYLKKLSAEALEYVRPLEEFQGILAKVAVPFYKVAATQPSALSAPGSAASRGIRPLGVGDLLVVKQELFRYSAGELAHIENVLKSESKTRRHSRSREVEEVVITEIETLEESEKDLQTTERFELHKEAQETIESEMSIEAGFSVSAGYGPVNVTAHADFALSESSSEASKSASTFAKQVTERSVSRIMQRAREERTRRTLERFEEHNEHGFDNTAGNGHIIGVYRWVDKYYNARIVNYGRRLMMEFIIPEPAAFYRHLQAKRPLEGLTLKRPEEPTASGRRLRPTDLTKWNYSQYVSEYNVQDVEPYPPQTTKVSTAIAEAPSPQGPNVHYAKAGIQLKVPDGYRAIGTYSQWWYQYQGTGAFINILIAGENAVTASAYDLEGIIPISVSGWGTAYNVSVTVQCALKEGAKEAWQLETYQAIMNTYERALADYNEQVAAAQIQAGVQIEGRNPEINREIEREELRKGALRLLTNSYAATRVSGAWRFNEMFNAMQSNGLYGYPEFDIDEASVEGKIIQFFEQAFEWENMTYLLYPYFWGRKSEWDETFPLNDPDPQFTDFLRAGAARVIVPVHLPYSETMLHYLNTNEIWNGGSPPTLQDPLYISIVDELKADTGADIDDDLDACTVDSGYPCVVDEWEVKLPTTLVYLQEDAKLPDFDNEDGHGG